jgi:hypothetical protein
VDGLRSTRPVIMVQKAHLTRKSSAAGTGTTSPL